MTVLGINLPNLGISSIEYLLAVFVGLFGGWKLLDRITPFNDMEEILDRENWAYTTVRVGMMAGLFAGFQSSINLHSPSEWSDPLWLAGAIVTTMLALSLLHFALERTVGQGIKPTDGRPTSRLGTRRRLTELKRDNMAVSLVKAGFYLAVGLVIGGAFDGDAPNVPTAVAATLVFIVLGCLMLFGLNWLHDKLTVYNLRQGVREGNLAAALEVFGLTVGLGITMRIAIAGSFVSWGLAFRQFFVSFGLAWVLMMVTRWFFGRVLLKHQRVADMHRYHWHAGAALMAAFMVLSAGIAAAEVTGL